MTDAHADALAGLRQWAAPTPCQDALRQEYVDHLVTRRDGLSRSCRPDHLTASALVLSPDGDRVLLTLHAKALRWFQFGGHVEPSDPSLVSAALREATEESGATDLRIDPVPVHLDAHEVPFCGGGDARTRHLDVRFLAVAAEESTTRVSEESVDVRWWACDALPSDEPSLRELVDLGRLRLVSQR